MLLKFCLAVFYPYQLSNLRFLLCFLVPWLPISNANSSIQEKVKKPTVAPEQSSDQHERGDCSVREGPKTLWGFIS